MSCPNKQPVRHQEYFLPGGDLYLQVDNVLFRIHKFFFERDSAHFRTLLDSPVAPNTTRSGSSETKPIAIRNSSPSEFAKFLFIFYNPKYSDYTDFDTADWTCVLKIACEHEFVEVQHCAIRALQDCDLSTVERIHVYKLYKVDPKYLVPLYIAMAVRDEGPTDKEVHHLGAETSLLIFRLREYLRSRNGFGGKSPLPPDVSDDDALRAVCHFLQVDVSQMQSLVSTSNFKGKKSPCPKGGKRGQGNY
ncbi:hypothetical protein BDN70DRAFT_696162 [Pholiota conissans]|uniref:BTB domain-containing protein n=1 Tax=Pholiota conissans TaxID=109636 RepID=A0A9P6D174_9AGAR|nr:hypothetical protein BDN70DRAFT_696162 [Pholiota conissans]